MWEIPAAYWHTDQWSDGQPRSVQNCTRYYGFAQPQVVKGFELAVQGRRRVYPRQMRIFITNTPTEPWQLVYENRDLPKEAKHVVSWTDEVSAQYFKVEVLAHHGSNGEHTEVAQDPQNVPFETLNGFTFITQDEHPLHRVRVPNLSAQPRLESPSLLAVDAKLLSAPKLTLMPNAVEVTYPWTRMTFSRLRPIQTHWSWDTERAPDRSFNLLVNHVMHPHQPVSGPWWQQVDGTRSGLQLGGRLTIGEGGIRYDRVEIIPGLVRDYMFQWQPDGLLLNITQTVDRPLPAIENEAWRWVWNHETAIMATLGHPLPEGKNGRCRFPALIHAPDCGPLAIELIEGDPATTFLKVDTWREQRVAYLGIEVGVTLEAGGELLTNPGSTQIAVKISPAKLQLGSSAKLDKRSMRRAFGVNWGGVFGFRPEYFGMSNNAASLNCHFIQHEYADMAYYTETSLAGWSMMDLCGYSIGLALRGGMGYGDNREYFLDTDASLLIGAGTYLDKTRDGRWADRHWAAIERAGQRLLGKTNGEGLAICGALTGNSGGHQWSSNWWDVISFGHLDAFSNALAYRAFRQMSSMARFMHDDTLAKDFDRAAIRLRSAYWPSFFNPDTGWLGGWRSQDGQLHDYAFLFINGMAVVYGLVPEAAVSPMMQALEKQRAASGFEYFSLGLPGNLIPVRREDYAEFVLGAPLAADGSDSYEFYENGGATMSQAYPYVRALGMAHMPVAERVGEEILRAFEAGEVFGGVGAGIDWRTWSGVANGYEGMLADQFYVLLAVAQNLGLAGPLSFDWG